MPKPNSYRVTKCRICKSQNLYHFLDLGTMPIPNGFIQPENLHRKEERFPLGTTTCLDCGLVQLTEVVNSSLMFKNYLYIPSTSRTMLDHFSDVADEVVARFSVGKDDLVIDIGSNDGSLLQFFKANQVRILGIDPAENLVKAANLKGLNSTVGFFTVKLAQTVKKKSGSAKVITATNVLAHIDDLNDVVKGVRELLAKDGVFIIEFPYIVDLIEKTEFDTIYHEHLSYFGLWPLKQLFARHSMRIFDAKRIDIHGGSLRIFVCFQKSTHHSTPRLNRLLNHEKVYAIHIKQTVDEFSKRVSIIKSDLLNLLKKLKKSKKSVVGYGAAAKGNVLLNYCRIGTSLLPYIVDSIPYKQGLYTPGTHIPIYPEKKLTNDQPDYVLILAWNFADEILKKQRRYQKRGGRFILTIP